MEYQRHKHRFQFNSVIVLNFGSKKLRLRWWTFSHLTPGNHGFSVVVLLGELSQAGRAPDQHLDFHLTNLDQAMPFPGRPRCSTTSHGVAWDIHIHGSESSNPLIGISWIFMVFLSDLDSVHLTLTSHEAQVHSQVILIPTPCLSKCCSSVVPLIYKKYRNQAAHLRSPCNQDALLCSAANLKPLRVGDGEQDCSLAEVTC